MRISSKSQEYNTIHKWAQAHIPTVLCSYCGATEKLHRCNISGLYMKIPSDWKILCARCHNYYDDLPEKTSARWRSLTHCRKGHELAEVGYYTYLEKGYVSKRCKRCQSERSAAYYTRKQLKGKHD